MTPAPCCDIFCRVVDNYGDIGVTWRLARQLAVEHGMTVRLFVDNLSSFNRLVPAISTNVQVQANDGVSVVAWREPLAVADTADLVIEAFGCELPAVYRAAMVARKSPPVWINLEHLSAESWVAGHHLLPSPHPSLPLTKYFFFPGFTPDTGGLIRERGLFTRRKKYIAAGKDDRLSVLVFGYENAPAEDLFAALAAPGRATICRVLPGLLSDKLKHWCGSRAKKPPEAAPLLEFEFAPFVPHAEFDNLLWQHDVLFVRGEDSFVRAQWAAKPFVWQAYPQAENAHLFKLKAFLDIYCKDLPSAADKALRDLWQAWNVPHAGEVEKSWQAFAAQLPALNAHALRWSKHLAGMPDLSANLLSFFRKNAKI